MRIDEPTTRDLELADELEEAAVGDVLHLARVDEPPHRDGAVVLDDRLDVLDRPHVHGDLQESFASSASVPDTSVTSSSMDVAAAGRLAVHDRAAVARGVGGQAEDWVALTTDGPYYALLNLHQFLELVPAPRGLTLDVGCGEAGWRGS